MAAAAEILVNSIKNGIDMLKVGRNPNSIVKAAEPADEIFEIPAFQSKFAELKGWEFLFIILNENPIPGGMIKLTNLMKLISDKNEEHIIRTKFWRALHKSKIIDNGFYKIGCVKGELRSSYGIDIKESFVYVKHTDWNVIKGYCDKSGYFDTKKISNHIPEGMWNNLRIRREILSDPEMGELEIPDYKISDILHLQSQIDELRKSLTIRRDDRREIRTDEDPRGPAAGGGVRDSRELIRDFGTTRTINIIGSCKMDYIEWWKKIGEILISKKTFITINDCLYRVDNEFFAYLILNPHDPSYIESGSIEVEKKIGHVIYIAGEVIIIK